MSVHVHLSGANNQTFAASVSIMDAHWNIVNDIGADQTATTTSAMAYKAPKGSWNSDTLTASYGRLTSATVILNRWHQLRSSAPRWPPQPAGPSFVNRPRAD